MSIYLICLTANGGLPILNRKEGDCENLPFSTMASLNGFHMFFRSLGISLHKTYAGSWTYVWRDFDNIITVIVSGSGIGACALDLLPEMVYGTFCMFVSRDEMANPSLPERLKKESKHYLPIIDALLDACVNQFLGFSNCLMSTDNAYMLQKLNQDLSAQCGSKFCCLLVGNKVAVGTEGWWDLDIVDRQLLLLLVQVSSSVQNDVAVYLPKKSPNVAYRFITIPVSSNSVLCIICGTEPTLKGLMDIAENVFRSECSILQNMERFISSGMPGIDELDSSIISVIIANSVTRKCAFSSNLHHSTTNKRILGDFQNMTALRMIFDQSVSNSNFLKENSTKDIFITDQYWSSDSYKVYAQTDTNNNMICILFTSSIPIHVMKCLPFIFPGSLAAKCSPKYFPKKPCVGSITSFGQRFSTYYAHYKYFYNRISNF